LKLNRLEILESMSMYQEAAFEKLYRWTQGELKTLTREIVELSPTFHQAIFALKDRPVLFK